MKSLKNLATTGEIKAWGCPPTGIPTQNFMNCGSVRFERTFKNQYKVNQIRNSSSIDCNYNL